MTITDTLREVFAAEVRAQEHDVECMMRFYNGEHGSALRFGPGQVVVNWHGQVLIRPVRRGADGQEYVDGLPGLPARESA